MPGFDKTGPMGQGPATGRGFGPCGMALGWRRKFGMGRGLGRYFGWNAPSTKEEKTEDLKNYRKALQEEIEDLDKELADLQK